MEEGFQYSMEQDASATFPYQRLHSTVVLMLALNYVVTHPGCSCDLETQIAKILTFLSIIGYFCAQRLLATETSNVHENEQIRAAIL